MGVTTGHGRASRAWFSRYLDSAYCIAMLRRNDVIH